MVRVSVGSLIHRVLAAIDLDRKPVRWAGEIDDVAADRMLSAEARCRKNVAKCIPQPPLGIGRAAAASSAQRGSGRSCRERPRQFVEDRAEAVAEQCVGADEAALGGEIGRSIKSSGVMSTLTAM